MNDSSSEEISMVVDEFLMLAQESALYHTCQEVREILSEAIRNLAATRRRVAIASDRYVVGVVGLTNVGKSTLLNALLGAELAPRRNGPCTAAPIEFTHGDGFRVTAYHRSSITRPSWQCADPEAVHQRLAMVAQEADDDASRQVRKVVVEAPLAILLNGLVIADTPGFGAAQIGNCEGSHEASLKGYLKDEVSQVFWVVLAEQGIGEREKSFHDSLFADICDDVVVTGCEDWETQDRERFRRRFVGACGTRLPRFHFVSGLKGLDARRTHDAEALESAGITMLETRIRELTDSAGRMAAIREGLVQLAGDLRYWLDEFRDIRHKKLSEWWRPDSWIRWRSCLPGSDLKKQLTTNLGGFA